MGSINIEGIEIEVIRKNIKNMHLYVMAPDGRVRITAPKRMKDGTIRLFATSKLDWIKKHRAKYQTKRIQPEKKFESGEVHFYQGEGYMLNVLHTNKKQRAEICYERKQIDLFVRDGSTVEQRKKVLTEWYRGKLKADSPHNREMGKNNGGKSKDLWNKVNENQMGHMQPKCRANMD